MEARGVEAAHGAGADKDNVGPPVIWPSALGIRRGRNAATDSGEAMMATRLRSLVLHGAVRADRSGKIRLLGLPSEGKGGWLAGWAMRGVIKPSD